MNVSDAVLLQKYLLGNGSLTNKQAIKADCNCNGSIDCFDMVVMRKLLIH
ncbi:MAG: dockerin type I repeat-containing protein [Ruminococcus sp.]|nr:dockerin type I repeat-containing protein [Ruminococcus sp.]